MRFGRRSLLKFNLLHRDTAHAKIRLEQSKPISGSPDWHPGFFYFDLISFRISSFASTSSFRMALTSSSRSLCLSRSSNTLQMTRIIGMTTTTSSHFIERNYAAKLTARASQIQPLPTSPLCSIRPSVQAKSRVATPPTGCQEPATLLSSFANTALSAHSPIRSNSSRPFRHGGLTPPE